MNNNPVRYTDPTGHDTECGIGESCHRAGYSSSNNSNSGNNNTTSSNDNEDEDEKEECKGKGLIDQYCVELTPEEAQALENYLDGPGDVGTATGIVGLVVDFGSLIAWANLSAFQKAIIGILIGGLEAPAAVVGLILSGTLIFVGWEANALSENLSDSGVTQTGGTLVVSTNLVYDVYEVKTPSGKTYTSYSATQFPVGFKVTSNMVYGWLAVNNASPFSWDW